jgi:hypothetical protein
MLSMMESAISGLVESTMVPVCEIIGPNGYLRDLTYVTIAIQNGNG